ncbi:hypothetical protein Cyrtocomes_01116 [Candidatus Cyrtobacter comes]|uniref:Uncharacterized protein n=1 Tax=Candidatus Cyrtobacter comes TaxID=675776 RepID=A0ABU5L9C4_9RICK|nr:hypothetical protein [Candidatus Cyrtobacter comes]MDZ5762722.1 hypothetical protein [Candidatus Cyrtobacter comes]
MNHSVTGDHARDSMLEGIKCGMAEFQNIKYQVYIIQLNDDGVPKLKEVIDLGGVL